MKKIHYFIGAFAFATLFTACKKEEEPHLNSAEITLSSPLASDTLRHGETLAIRGSIVSVMDLHGYSAHIKRTDTGAEVFSYEDHYHGMNKNLQIDWPCDVNAGTGLELTLLATLDHDGHTASRSVTFMCKP